MIESDVIVVGGGAAGLIAARDISKMKKVILLEARNRPGGRIYTSASENFSLPLELGAEFIHGDLPITKSLLRQANLTSYKIEGDTYQVNRGNVRKSKNVIEGLPVLISKAKELREDITFTKFLKEYFNDDKYRKTRESAVRFVEGYDAADIEKASTLALREEWESEAAESAYRIEGGYGMIIDFLLNEVLQSGSEVYYSSTVKEIKWRKNNIEVITEKGEIFKSRKILITVPAGILKSTESNRAYIKYSPALNDQMKVLEFIEYGSVIKVFFEFKTAFWESAEGIPVKITRPGFIISDTEFTAWWTQLPKKVPMLTGWLAGPAADKMNNRSTSHLIDKAADALCLIFKIDRSFLEMQIRAKFAVNWKDDPFSMGAYSYATVDTPAAKKILNEPVKETIFFAGEAFSENESVGTVEAAFDSGCAAAERLLKLWK